MFDDGLGLLYPKDLFFFRLKCMLKDSFRVENSPTKNKTHRNFLET